MPIRGLGTVNTSPVDVQQHYVAALARFGEQLQQVADHEWDLPTPCSEWDVRQVAAHVILGEVQSTELITGTGSGDIGEVDASIVGVSPITVWRGTALAAIDAARSIDPLNSSFAHPAGQLSGAQLLGWRISENLIHAWDLAQAIGRPAPISEELAEVCLEFWWPVAEKLMDTTDYAGVLEADPGAGAGSRLLALLGRRG